MSQDPSIPAIAPKSAPDATLPASGVESTAPAGEVDAVGAAERAEPTAATSGVEASNHAIAEALRAGSIDATQACERLIDEVLADLGAGLPAEQVAELRARIAASLADDPTVARLLDPSR